MVEENKLINIETEYLKLIKNTKGYNWEIKTLGLDVDKIEQLNNQMKEKFEIGGHSEVNTVDI